jgi:hypothetical protein
MAARAASHNLRLLEMAGRRRATNLACSMAFRNFKPAAAEQFEIERKLTINLSTNENPREPIACTLDFEAHQVTSSEELLPLRMVSLAGNAPNLRAVNSSSQRGQRSHLARNSPTEAPCGEIGEF